MRDVRGVAILEDPAINGTLEGKLLWVRDGLCGDEAWADGCRVIYTPVSTIANASAIAYARLPKLLEKPH